MQVPAMPGGPPEGVFVVTLAFFMLVGVGLIVLGPIGRALADRLRGRHRQGLDAEQVEELRDELREVHRQLAELEERQDFAERLLAQARGQGLLGAPPEPR